MSYSAFVHCTCYQGGKTSPPPYEDYVKFDDDGIDIHIPDALTDDNEDLFYKMYGEFQDWKFNACPHEDMEYCLEHLCNISGMADFRSFINQNDNFPILTQVLPTANGGIVPSHLAPVLLKELELLENQKSFVNKIYLIQKNNNQIKAICDEDNFTIFAFFENYKYGIDANGFFMLRTEIENEVEVHYEVFRSKYFSIRKSNFENSVRLFCEKTAAKHLYGMTLADPGEDASCIYYIIEKRQEESNNYYQYIIEPLKNLALASIETGNPIHWC